MAAALASCTQSNPAFHTEVYSIDTAPPALSSPDPSSAATQGKHSDELPSVGPMTAEPDAAAEPAAAAEPDAAADADASPSPPTPPPPPGPDAAAPDIATSACGGGAPVGWAYIAPGSFMMGSPSSEKDRESQEVLHPVTITRPFWLSATEVTRREWQTVMPKDPSDYTKCGLDCPVELVTWFDTVAYANAAGMRDGFAPCYFTDAGAVYDAAAAVAKKAVRWTAGLTCPGYRLPTEAEWEYAARAGSTTAFPGGTLTGSACTPLLAVLDAIGWYCGNGKDGSHPVAKRGPNPWGVYDVYGNVWEWVWDASGSYPSGAVTDPIGPASGTERISRGGAYHNSPNNCRAAVRASDKPSDVYHDTGFRLARTAFAP